MERGLKSQEKTMTQPALPLVRKAVWSTAFPSNGDVTRCPESPARWGVKALQGIA